MGLDELEIPPLNAESAKGMLCELEHSRRSLAEGGILLRGSRIQLEGITAPHANHKCTQRIRRPHVQSALIHSEHAKIYLKTGW